MSKAIKFWEGRALSELNQIEWESLCDGCAKCCLVKLEDDDDGQIYYTNVACQYLDHATCRCTDYVNRNQLAPSCLRLKPEHLGSLEWLPSTCSYRLVAEGKPLPEWHHLLTGDTASIHRHGASVKGKCISESHVHPEDLVEHVVRWVG